MRTSALLLMLGAALALAGVAAPAAPAATYLYVTNEGDNTISQFKVDQGSDELEPLSKLRVGPAPRGILAGRDAQSVYVTSGTGRVNRFRIGPTGALQPVDTVDLPGAGGVAGLAQSPDGKSLYVADANGLYQLDVTSGGALRLKDPPVLSASGLWDVAVYREDQGPSVWAVGRDGVIWQYDAGPRGELTPKPNPTVRGSGGAGELLQDLDLGVLWATSSRGLDAYQVARDGTLSGPTVLGGLMATAGGRLDDAMTVEGRALYVTAPSESFVYQFDIGRGAMLTPMQPPRVGAPAPAKDIVAPWDTTSAYVVTSATATASEAIIRYGIGPDGRLTLAREPGQPLPVGPGAFEIAEVWRATARRDVVTGTAGNDRIAGLGGADVIRGRAGDDVLLGGRGADRLAGGAGRDRLAGGPGRDRLAGGRGADRIAGGPGRDVVEARGGGRDRIACGPGRDTVRADRRDRVVGCERPR